MKSFPKRFATAAMLFMAACVIECMAQNDLLTPEKLWSLGRVGSQTACPDGKHIMYTVSTPDIKANKIITRICTIAADGTSRKCLTNGSDSESQPVYIQGGTRIAFLSKGNLWTMNYDGENRQQLYDKGDLEGFLFSPDETQVIVIRQVETTRSIQAKESDLPLATGMVIDDINYRHWDQEVKTIPHIFLASVIDNKLRIEKDILEGEPYECPALPFGGTEQFCWSPDGKSIAYSCKKKTGVAYATSTDTDIYLYHIATAATTNLCKPADYKEPAAEPTKSMALQAKNQSTKDIHAGFDTEPQFSPDGSHLAWKSQARDGYESDRERLCVLELKTGKHTYVTETFESNVESYAWGKDNKTIYFTGVWNGRTMVYQTNQKGAVQTLTAGDYDFGSVAVMPNGKQLLTNRHSMSSPDDLYLLTPVKGKGGVLSQVTQENKAMLDALTMGEVKERWVQTTDGLKEHCWVIYPPHFNPEKQYPTLLFCEGGPQSPVSQFWSYRWNFQIMAAHGYIIIAPNRRGLPGFGMEWLEQISGDYSGQCMKDYLSAIDDIVREPYVDKNRLGCVGASFGGYSVYWLAGNHDKRFKAFIAHDGIFNTTQQYYETEEMWFANWDLGGAPSHEGDKLVFTESPHRYVDKWDTPILCIHGEKDYRILSSQGISAFNAARMHGIPAQLLLYPDENHWVLKPQNGILWQRTFFRWLDRWVK